MSDEEIKRFRIQGKTAKEFVENAITFQVLKLGFVITNKVDTVSGFEIRDLITHELIARGTITYAGRYIAVPNRVDITVFSGRRHGDVLERSVIIHEGKPVRQPLAVR